MEKNQLIGQVIKSEERNTSIKKQKNKNYLLRFRYKITLNTYKEIKDFQDNKCAICKQEKENLVVDHCHETGNVRGLLCSNCNSLLGFAKDNKVILESAIEYLSFHKTKNKEEYIYDFKEMKFKKTTTLFFDGKTKKITYCVSKN